ncbi:MAG TPA: prepilin-type N-terminal cleavage/methylation domain-containing protein [Gemmatimonadales bacterium]|nr:prepilin-type N-terminal cleavage/methylation domain-containing protein [Gemmatimonadales bacterium]
MSTRRAGFTLVEVIVALLVTSVILTMSVRLFGTSARAVESLRADRRSLDRQVNAHRWLAAAFLSADLGDSATVFVGNTNGVGFQTWLQTPDGWFEQRDVLVRQDGHRLVASSATDTMSLDEAVDSVAFDYLLATGAESRWVREWAAGRTAPAAVRMRVRHTSPDLGAGDGSVDTALFLVKVNR